MGVGKAMSKIVAIVGSDHDVTDPSGVFELTDRERAFLGMHARYEAESHLDPRYYRDMSLDERWARYNRWFDIADALDRKPFGPGSSVRRVRED